MTTIFRDDLVRLLPQLRALAHGLTAGNRPLAGIVKLAAERLAEAGQDG
jgi:hypothetical protein